MVLILADKFKNCYGLIERNRVKKPAGVAMLMLVLAIESNVIIAAQIHSLRLADYDNDVFRCF